MWCHGKITNFTGPKECESVPPFSRGESRLRRLLQPAQLRQRNSNSPQRLLLLLFFLLSSRAMSAGVAATAPPHAAASCCTAARSRLHVARMRTHRAVVVSVGGISTAGTGAAAVPCITGGRGVAACRVNRRANATRPRVGGGGGGCSSCSTSTAGRSLVGALDPGFCCSAVGLVVQTRRRSIGGVGGGDGKGLTWQCWPWIGRPSGSKRTDKEVHYVCKNSLIAILNAVPCLGNVIAAAPRNGNETE